MRFSYQEMGEVREWEGEENSEGNGEEERGGKRGGD